MNSDKDYKDFRAHMNEMPSGTVTLPYYCPVISDKMKKYFGVTELPKCVFLEIQQENKSTFGGSFLMDGASMMKAS